MRFILKSTTPHNPDETIQTFNKQFNVSDIEREAADWGFEYQTGNTMFDVINAYTRGAQYNKLNAESSYRLNRIGGDILALVN